VRRREKGFTSPRRANVRIDRRTFITLLSAAAICPFAVRAQQPAREAAMPVIGFLDRGSPTGMSSNIAAFARGLSESGYSEGKNVAIAYRWAENRNDRLPVLAAELVRLPVAVIAATRSSAPALAAKAATSTIPIVFQTGSDPVKDGLVESLNRPGGNVTGATRLTTELVPKRLGVLLELVPKATTIGMLINPNGVQTEIQVREMQAAARAHGLALRIAQASKDDELEAAFATLARDRVDAIVEGSDPLFIDQRKHIVALTISNKIPTMFFEYDSVTDGGLMTYAANFADSFRQVGSYVGRLLKGEKPADLPVLEPTKFDLVINLKTAKAIGVSVPPMLLALADQVIE
jgi:putative ABC transport system substrate-binding protein